MSAHVRSHGRLVVTNEPEEKLQIKYEPLSKTAFLINVDYYGWVKSIALSIAGDITEDEHGIYPVHGACVDLDGQGASLIAPPGTGKTTHTYGLLRLKGVRVVADDWFFVRIEGDEAVAFGSEKNFYVQADIAEIWGEYQKLIQAAELDQKGRAVINVRRIVGKGRILPLTTVKKVVILKRDPYDEVRTREVGVEEAVDYLERNSFCNPHLLVKDDRKMRLRRRFFREFLSRSKVFIVNSVPPPVETNELIQKIIRS